MDYMKMLRLKQGASEKWWFPSEADAEQAAISEVANLFVSEDHLPRVHHFLAEYEKKLQMVESQLSSAVRTQMDETRLGMDYLLESVDTIRVVRENFMGIDKFCTECKNLIREYDEIQVVNTADLNLQATVRLRADFNSIPVRTKAIKDMLESDDQSIKECYKKLRLLVDVQDRAYARSSGFPGEVIDQLQVVFKELVDAADFVEKRVWDNVEDCEILAVDDRLALIRTLEVIEMEDRAKRKVFSGLGEPLPPTMLSTTLDHANAGADGNGESSTKKEAKRRSKTMRERAFEHLDSAIALNFEEILMTEEAADAKAKREAAAESESDSEEDYFKGSGDDSDEGGVRSPIHAIDTSVKLSSKFIMKVLGELRSSYEDLVESQQLLGELFPEHYNISQFYTQRYQHYIKAALLTHCGDPSRLERVDLLRCVSWLEWYINELEYFLQMAESERQGQDFAMVKIDDSLRQLLSLLMEAFVKGMKKGLLKLMNGIVRVEHEGKVSKGSDGAFYTSGPQDFFFTLNQQLNTVLEYGLTGKSLRYVALMIADIFDHHVQKQLEFTEDWQVAEDNKDGEAKLVFGPKREVLTQEFFCATINNALQSQEFIDELKEVIMDKLAGVDKGGKSRSASISVSRNTSSMSFSMAASEVSSFDTGPVDEEIENILDQAEIGYTQVATAAVNMLVHFTMCKLQPFYKSMFTTAWSMKSGEGGLTDILLDVVHDECGLYNEGIRKQVFFHRIVKALMKELVAEYVRCIYQRDKSIKFVSFADGENVDKLKADYESFQEFFMDFEGMMPKKLIEAELFTLKLLYEVMSKEFFVLQHYDFTDFVKKFGDRSLVLIEAMLNMRTEIKKAERTIVMNTVKQMTADADDFQTENDSGGKRDGGGPTKELERSNSERDVAKDKQKKKAGFGTRFFKKFRSGDKKASKKKDTGSSAGKSNSNPSSEEPPRVIRTNTASSVSSNRAQEEEVTIDMSDFLA